MHRIIRFVPALALFAMPAAAFAQQAPQTAEIHMQGTGEVTAGPDMAHITSGVTTQAETAREALDANNAAMSNLVDVLTEAGIAERDIQTSNFTVQPQYVHSDERDADGFTRPPRISGYQVSNSVTVRVRELDDLGAVLDQAVTVGANTINNVSFDLSDPGDVLDEARRMALEDATRKAELYAEAAGVSLGRILNISERTGQPPRPMMRDMAVEAAYQSAVPVQSGELTHSVSVDARWAIAQDAAGTD